MASTDKSPTYQRCSIGDPVKTSSRRAFRRRNKYLILLVLLALLTFGALFFYPEFIGTGTVSGVHKDKEMNETRPDVLTTATPYPGKPSETSGNSALRYDVESQEDPHRVEEIVNPTIKTEDGNIKDVKESGRPNVEEPVNKNSAESSTKIGEPAKPINKIVEVAETLQKARTIPPLESSHHPVTQGGEDKDPTVKFRRDKVKEMMKHAWENYVKYAWGENELRPVSNTTYSGIFEYATVGTTIVDSLDTLYIMGLIDEFNLGRDWVADKFSLDHLDVTISVFETNIRFVGGLLACFALTGDVMFRNKAELTAQKLLPAFQSPTGIPYTVVNPTTGKSRNHWMSDGSSLTLIGTLTLEFSYLSDVTGDSVYRSKVDRIRNILEEMTKTDGLYPNYIDPETGEWGKHHMSIGGGGDSFYEYLLKEWIRSGREDHDLRRIYDEAMEAVMTHMLQTSAGGLMYFSDLKDDELDHRMEHLACFSGGLLALGGNTLQNTRSTRYTEVGEGITHTCHESYFRTATKLGPDAFNFANGVEAEATDEEDKRYILRPEVVESYFYMWRITKNPKYRDWGWEVVQALEKHSLTPGGYSGIVNVYEEDSQKDDIQQSFFLSETLKYLYLLFSDDSLISLDEWVFNTEGHPLPIKGVNPYYRGTSTVIYQ